MIWIFSVFLSLIARIQTIKIVVQYENSSDSKYLKAASLFSEASEYVSNMLTIRGSFNGMPAAVDLCEKTNDLNSTALKSSEFFIFLGLDDAYRVPDTLV